MNGKKKNENFSALFINEVRLQFFFFTESIHPKQTFEKAIANGWK
jgi:hypothetical protein